MPPDRPEPGERVRITAGQLAGLTGVIRHVTEAGSCALTCDALAEGVFIVVLDTLVERCDETGHR